MMRARLAHWCALLLCLLVLPRAYAAITVDNTATTTASAATSLTWSHTVGSGADRILAAMNRRHDVDLYKRLVDRLRAARPDLALSSDFIVGYPGETDAEFDATLRLIDEIGFAQAFTFKYSKRHGTPTANEDDHVPEPVKAERLAALQARVIAQQTDFNRACVGRTLPVLF